MTNIDSASPEISIVIPLFNEEANFEELTRRLIELNKKSNLRLEIVMVSDGSYDKTPFLMHELSSENNLFTSVFLSRNFGHQIAVSAGLMVASGTKAVFIIDGDLQDPPELLFDFYNKLNEGFDVVYGIRRKRKEGWGKKILYWFYYRMLKSIANTELNLDSGDFSLVSRRVVNYMNAMPEKNRYLRGLRSWIGFKQFGFEYERDSRFAGEPKYSFKKLFELAYSGIFNFSDFPIKFITRLGLSVIFIGIAYTLYVMYRKFAFGDVPQGFSAIIFFMTLFTGTLLIAIGMVGEYVIRIFKQVQNRPLLIIDKVLKNQKELNGQELFH
jgi:glycosyltransferase involved in cell wall biosynthesis